jgi:ATP-dependent DNA helicase RecG
MASMRRSDRTKFRQSVVEPLLEAGWLARTVPDRPRSRFQKYVTTPAGREFLEVRKDPR